MRVWLRAEAAAVCFARRVVAAAGGGDVHTAVDARVQQRGGPHGEGHGMAAAENQHTGRGCKGVLPFRLTTSGTRRRRQCGWGWPRQWPGPWCGCPARFQVEWPRRAWSDPAQTPVLAALECTARARAQQPRNARHGTARRGSQSRRSNARYLDDVGVRAAGDAEGLRGFVGLRAAPAHKTRWALARGWVSFWPGSEAGRCEPLPSPHPVGTVRRQSRW